MRYLQRQFRARYNLESPKKKIKEKEQKIGNLLANGSDFITKITL